MYNDTIILQKNVCAVVHLNIIRRVFKDRCRPNTYLYQF